MPTSPLGLKVIVDTALELCRRGYNATVEHPGYIDVQLLPSRTVAFGDVNDYWGLDWYDTVEAVESGQPSGHLDSKIVRTETNPIVIANACIELIGQIPAAAALSEIRAAMDGKEWNADTLDAVADVLRRNGFALNAPE